MRHFTRCFSVTENNEHCVVLSSNKYGKRSWFLSTGYLTGDEEYIRITKGQELPKEVNELNTITNTEKIQKITIEIFVSNKSKFDNQNFDVYISNENCFDVAYCSLENSKTKRLVWDILYFLEIVENIDCNSLFKDYISHKQALANKKK